jgi:ZIP family zinc transporter
VSPAWAALGWGLAAGAALPLGAAAGCWLKLPQRAVAAVMAFGSGTLLAALSLILIQDAYQGASFAMTALGFLAGAAIYTAADLAIRWRSGKRHASPAKDGPAESGLAIAAGSFIDNIPEGVVIGMSAIGGAVNPVILVAVFISNFPEALASAARMREARWSALRVFAVWIPIGIACGLASLSGHAVFSGLSAAEIALTQAIAAGAILAMLADTLIPQAFEGAHDYSGLIMALGFLLAFGLNKAA